MILALDLGTRTGWAVGNTSLRASGVERLTPLRGESVGMRFVKFRTFLNGMLAAYRIDMVAYEGVSRHAGTIAAHIYGGLLSQLMVFCEEHGIDYMGIPVGTIKKHATGKGNASKEMMCDAFRSRWIVDPQTDDEADAAWLLDYVIHNYGDAIPETGGRNDA